MTCVVGENLYLEANSTIVDEVVLGNNETNIQVVAAKHHHDYSSKDFEYVSTRPSTKGSKRSSKGHSGKGGGGKGSSGSSKEMSGKGGKGTRGGRGGRSGSNGDKKKDSKKIISKSKQRNILCRDSMPINLT